MSYAGDSELVCAVNDDRGFFQEPSSNEQGEESDPLASESDGSGDAERKAREEIFGPSMEELIAESRSSRRPRRRKRRRTGVRMAAKRARMSDVPRHLASVMGSATVAFMMCRFDEAEESLQRLVQEAPKAAAPHRTLGLIYEEQGKREQALGAFMKAAELDRTDRELWKRNAKVFEEMGDNTKAIYCLSNALKGTRMDDQEALRARGMLYMKIGSFKKAADSFIKLSKVIPSDVGVAQLICHSYGSANDQGRAVAPIEAMLYACEQKVPKTNNPDVLLRHEGTLAELVQLLVELRFQQQRFYDASLLIGRLQNRGAVTGRPLTFVQRLMLAICQHRLGSETLASPTILEFMSSPSMVSKHRFFLWEVADACRDSGDYRKAARAYSLLIECEDETQQVQLHLNRAACFKELGNRQGAREDLETVLRLEPRNVEASLRIVEFLSAAERQVGKGKKCRKSGRWQGVPQSAAGGPFPYAALAGVLSTPSEDRNAAMETLSRAKLSFDQGDFRGFLSLLYPALEAALHLRSVSRHGNERAIVHDVTGEQMMPKEKATVEGPPLSSDAPKSTDTVRKRAGLQEQGLIAEEGENAGSSAKFWSSDHLPATERARLHAVGSKLMRVLDDELFVDVAERIVTCFWHEGDVALAHPVTRLFVSLAHLRIKGKDCSSLRIRLRLMDVVTSVAAGDVHRAYEHVRLMLVENPTDPNLCLVFSIVDELICTTSEAYKYRSWRSLNRLIKKNPDSVLLLLLAANCTMRGSVHTNTYTAGLYLRAFKLMPDHPLICLSVAIHLLYLALSRRVENRNEMVMHAFAFLDDYRRKRTDRSNEQNRKWLEMETTYNIGRAMHQLGLLDMATDMYRTVLQHEVNKEEEIPVWADLRRDAAYNLSLIYQASGASELARAIIFQYLAF